MKILAAYNFKLRRLSDLCFIYIETRAGEYTIIDEMISFSNSFGLRKWNHKVKRNECNYTLWADCVVQVRRIEITLLWDQRKGVATATLKNRDESLLLFTHEHGITIIIADKESESALRNYYRVGSINLPRDEKIKNELSRLRSIETKV